MGRLFGIFVASAATIAPMLASAQIDTSAVPAEFPPTSYTANQYIDSEGCAFIRAGISGVVTWIPRVGRDRVQFCGFQPSLAQAPAPAAPAPIESPASSQIATGPAPAPTPVPAPAAAPARVAAPVPAALLRPRVQNVGAPITTAASITTPPTIGAAIGAPVPAAVAAPVAAPEAPVAAAPRRITFAQACRGRTGIQPTLVNVRTRAPIDCGTGAAVIPAVAAGPATQGPVRMTLAQVCAAIDESGRRYIDNATGRPVVCPSAPVRAPIVMAGSMVPGGPMAPGAGVQPAAAGTRLSVAMASAACPPGVRCGPQVQSPSGRTAPLGQVGTHAVARARTPAALEFLIPAPIPASNPVGLVERAKVEPGYAPVWDDGRVNPARGLPRTVGVIAPQMHVSAQAVAPRRATATAMTPATMVVASPAPQSAIAPAPQAAVARYVQVGSYGEPANAQRAVATLQSLGLPVGLAGSASLRIVVAGPFGDVDSAQSALRTARGAGYGDAYIR